MLVPYLTLHNMPNITSTCTYTCTPNNIKKGQSQSDTAMRITTLALRFEKKKKSGQRKQGNRLGKNQKYCKNIQSFIGRKVSKVDIFTLFLEEM